MKHEVLSSQTTSPPSLSISEMLSSSLLHAARSLTECASQLPESCEKIVHTIKSCRGKVVFSGIGKSGLIARKCSATFSSLGIPSFFIHPLEALHGDIGAVAPNDVCIIFSKSGESEEIKRMISYYKHIQVQTILISCHKGSLVECVDHALVLPFQKESSLFVHAPSTSSVLMMAFCDTIALIVASLKNFDELDFARRHPAGSLGNSLLLTVESIMHKKEALPFLHRNDVFKKIISEITLKKLGVGIVLNDDASLAGIITDGDLRRACDQGEIVFKKKAADIMTPNPQTIPRCTKAIDALQIMKDASRTSLIIIEGISVIGLVRMHEIVNSGIKL